MTRPAPRLAALGAAALLCAACADPEDLGAAGHAVRDGSPAPDDISVVALSLRAPSCSGGPGAVVCTGALISSQVVLTAGHCVEPYGRGRLEVWTGASLDSPVRERRAARRMRLHPLYTDVSSAFDAAVIFLGSPLSAAPTPLLATPMDATWVGRPVRVVGFGETGGGAGAGERRSGTAVITAVAEHTFELAPDPALSCRGDSGGPVLAEVDGVETVIGIISSGDIKCTEWSVAARVDTLAADLLNDALSGPPPEKATITLAEACSAPCAGDLDCPADLVCEQRDSGEARCVLPAFEPGRFGALCEQDSECPGGECVSLDAECRCHSPCDAPPTPPQDQDEDEDAGCSAAPAHPPSRAGHRAPSWPWAWACSLLLLAIRRRRARLSPGR